MTNSEYLGPDAARSRLRATIATIERELASLPPTTPGPDGQTRSSPLLASFADLVQQLALGPEPELRVCPVCKEVGMRAATICSRCWTKLAPLPKPDAGGSA